MSFHVHIPSLFISERERNSVGCNENNLEASQQITNEI